MKKQFLIFATITTVVFTSCSKEKIEAPQQSNSEEISTAKAGGGGNGLVPVSNKGLLGRFEFDGNLKDAAGKLQEGQPTGRVLYTADRKRQLNKAILFNATYGVDIFNVPSSPDGASLSVWIKHDTVPNPGWIASVFSVKAFIIQQNFNFFAGSYQTGLMNAQQIVYSTGVDKQWHHMAVTRDNNELKFYIDGILIGTSPTPAGTGPFDIADKYSLAHAFNIMWKGSLDDLRFYSRVLSASEIQTLSTQ